VVSVAVISADNLDAIKGLARLVLKRERECTEHGSPLTTTASSELTAQLLAVPDSPLLAAIQRHRLESLLHGDPLVGALLPKLADKIKALARAETMAALALASLTREMAALFERARIPMRASRSACNPPDPSQPGGGVIWICWWIQTAWPMPCSSLSSMVLYVRRGCSQTTSTAFGGATADGQAMNSL